MRIHKSLYYRTRAAKNSIGNAVKRIHERFAHRSEDKYIRLVSNAEANCGTLHGKDVLEVGCDQSGQFLSYLCKKRSVASAVGINPCLAQSVRSASFSLLKEDARKMPFADNSFDVILSISVFEHVQDLDIAISEMFRVLRPGGYILTEFGPIWSSVWGHHLWLYHGNKVRDWENTPIPPYAHLLMPEIELREWCSQKYNDNSLTEKICDFVFRSPDQNRLFYSDYEKIFKESQFNTLYMTGFPDLPFSQNYAPKNIVELFSRLKEKYPEKSGFGYHVASALLFKPM